MDLELLEEIAKTASPGPWCMYSDNVDAHDLVSGKTVSAVAYVESARRDADYIAAFGPDTGLALITEIRRLQKQIDQLERELVLTRNLGTR